MNILAIDTSTEACSVALQTSKGIDCEFDVCPQQHSQKILGMIDAVLKRNGAHLSDMQLLAYGCGPGSFTGVRIAASTMQGLALGTNLPVAEVSTLATMAQENAERFNVSKSLALIDARMSEVYKGQYTLDATTGGVVLQGEEAVIPPNEVVSTVVNYDHESFVGTGYAAYKDILGLTELPKPLNVEYPNAKYMLALAKQAQLSGKTVSASEIVPTYLRDKVTWKKLPGRE
ncbi:tRNA (adenosine(37)-N6)-threonylcarbamoyltransferase complex dimerization subunit type 1 TsaB [Agaribacter marinus]|uniref:tRNA threonylcarbamoyladenosine biosynthesis protein TsaB n=1 Tax=Agaribacter marinus TaxID=1431249 RepID=A0AA37SWX3_9ALTE|nr:tRNA (adenosine(37)-N6)-threonylcarbamoyltransferase complex dimerization subunit type 1 TsaB [Agaribacter marinus]GLR69660.1 tRNA (adenosine(37)-N6)-threonylcarbamoyltransferase complex dimerization subunit type 1 TsaB [Agaribacter marinus]